MAEEENGVAVKEDQEEQKVVEESEEKPPTKSQEDEINKKFQKMGISFSIWPPTQRTRDAVINRLIETLSKPSILSKRYGSLNPDEAASTARVIEEQAFVAASSTSSSVSGGENSGTTDGGGGDDDGIEILQIYSKEISKRMLESVKSKAATSAIPASENDSNSVAATSEEISSS
ncbi:hypothetical protein C5167_038119 [Papaver somniferum]|uniref:WPP domain-containing protein n=1 Tax=Papaver somniferum TaxID=3469 RepID=A0A4Y7ICC9_PAPSO|nr:MFP1 attachment factor 1-like [Papaver somniferum]RZC45158.1 hypothetical protein C5167_038119 [Papaver somniferum]